MTIALEPARRLVREGVRLGTLVAVLVFLVVVRLLMVPVQLTTGVACVGLKLTQAAVRGSRVRDVLAQSTDTTAVAWLVGTLATLCACTRQNPWATLVGVVAGALLATERDRVVARSAPDRPTAADPLLWPLRDLQLLRPLEADGSREAAMATRGTEDEAAPPSSAHKYVASTPSGVRLHAEDLTRHGGTVVEFVRNEGPHEGTYCCHFLMPNVASAAAVQNVVNMWRVARKHASTHERPGLYLYLVVRMFPHGRLTHLVEQLQETRWIRVATIPRRVLSERAHALRDTRAMFKKLLELTDPTKPVAHSVYIAQPHAVVRPPTCIEQIIAFHNMLATAAAEEAANALACQEVARQAAEATKATEAAAEERAKRAAEAATRAQTEAEARERAESLARTVQLNQQATKRRSLALAERKRCEAEAARRERSERCAHPLPKSATLAPDTSTPVSTTKKGGKPTATVTAPSKPPPPPPRTFRPDVYTVSSNRHHHLPPPPQRRHDRRADAIAAATAAAEAAAASRAQAQLDAAARARAASQASNDDDGASYERELRAAIEASLETSAPEPQPATNNSQPCRLRKPCHFGPGRCRNGAACKFSHDAFQARTAAPAATTTTTTTTTTNNNNNDNNDNNGDDDTDTCVVCLDAPRTHIGVACFHLVLCAECAPKCNDTCPFCSATTEFRRVYK